MTKTFITDKDGATIDASTATIPSDRHFRSAWKISGSVISEDMNEAKKIFKDKIREVRKPLLEAEKDRKTVVKCTIDGGECFVPMDLDNKHYAEIVKQVEEKKLTIKDADE